ncbi:MAG: chemotaxis protein CheW [Microvirga sp.]
MRSHSPSPQQAGTVDACWNRIGVRGDKSCAALEVHAHCRNCPTYSVTATTLLDREILADSVRAWSEHYAKVQQAERPKDLSAVLFRVGTEWFALDTRIFDEVVEPRAVHRLPHRRSPVVLGITNIRGELVVCVSIARLLDIAESPPEAGGRSVRLLVLRTPSGRIAIPVDEVQHTHRYHEGERLPPPATSARSATSFTSGLLAWQGRMVSSLDDIRLLDAFDRSLA